MRSLLNSIHNIKLPLMAVAFFIAVVTAAISLPSCGQGGCVTDAKKVRYLAIAEAKTDTSGSIRT